MNAKTRLISYPEERALEDAAYAQGVVPTWIFSILLPIWCVEVKATVTEAEPYELIDRYLERGIAEAGLDTPAELAAFFALDEILVDRALRFLTAIGHVTVSGERLSLTELGHQSVRDQVRYVLIRQDRRKLYFDAFGSRPLTRPYYDSRTVTFLSGSALQAAVASRGWPRFLMLNSTHGFRREALTELARNPKRDHYNLPERIDKPESLGEECVYLPLYVIRAVQQDKQVRYLAYTQASDQADLDVTALCEQTAEISSLFETEERLARSDLQTRITEWLRKKNLDGYRPVQLNNGTWRVTFPSSIFDTKGPLSISKLGSFIVLNNGLFHVWCTDEQVRRRALLERIDAYLSSRVRIDRADTEKRITQITRQLEFGTINIPTLHQMAIKAGKQTLAAQLDRLT